MLKIRQPRWQVSGFGLLLLVTLRSASNLSKLCSMGTVEYLTRSTCSFQVHSVPSCWPLPFLFFFLLFNDSITLSDPLIDPSAVFSISNLRTMQKRLAVGPLARTRNQKRYGKRRHHDAWLKRYRTLHAGRVMLSQHDSLAQHHRFLSFFFFFNEQHDKYNFQKVSDN
ncbi:hypothetical protein PUN28_019131 [Cardiocondyla obscurior]|uniref:Secreted protein n=1 Tax=Cardiocondyla obscurior TaxID=286306 RepID=A0AAW2EDJ9_9HYME